MLLQIMVLLLTQQCISFIRNTFGSTDLVRERFEFLPGGGIDAASDLKSTSLKPDRTELIKLERRVGRKACAVFIDGCFSLENSFDDEEKIPDAVLGLTSSNLCQNIEEIHRFNFISVFLSSDTSSIDKHTEIPSCNLALVHIYSPSCISHSTRNEGEAESGTHTSILIEGKKVLHLTQYHLGGAVADAPPGEQFSIHQHSCIECETLVSIKNGGRLEHLYMQDLSSGTSHQEKMPISLSEGSSYELSTIQIGGFHSRIATQVTMISPHTSCSLTGLALCEAYQDLGVDTLIMHDAPRTQSTHFHRIVSENYGTGRFKGKVRIPENSLKSEASQMCRIVLLGQRGRITAEPTLDIVADDVTCAHGLSVADVNEDEIFYMTCRGIKREEAWKLLVLSFAEQVLQSIPSSVIPTIISAKVGEIVRSKK